MTYNFSTLSPADFEDLSRELIGMEVGVRFEGFSSGPDGGIDGRFSVGSKTTILQAKHYFGSPFSSLAAAMKRERASIDGLAPDRYLLSTSRPLSPPNKLKLAGIIGPCLKTEGDIFGPVELNSLLRKFPDVDRGHIKLWLSSAAVLDRIVRSSAYAFTATSRAEIEAKVRVYAQNPSFKEARDRLEENHVLIISGPPGVGKTTLAEMLSYAYIGEEWEFVAIRSLEDGFAAIVDAKKQIFFFDDFLGKVALDTKALASKDSELVRFIRRIRRTSNARFILTTRAYIFEEAKRVSEYIADRQLDITTYVLDVGIYTRRIRARILYNHLHVSKLPKENIQSLLESGLLPKIIDHRNYNPRIIEWMTDLLNVDEIPPEKYVEQFIEALNHPSRIWDTAFRTHIPFKCQSLLFALFFCSEYGVEIDDLDQAFSALHPELSKKYGFAYSTKDFSEAVRILEGSFIKITGAQISFINPSVRDYLTEYLRDPVLLSDFAPLSQFTGWAKAVWLQFLSIPEMDTKRKAAFAELFVPALRKLRQAPTWVRARHDQTSLRSYDLYPAERAALFFEWWKVSRNAAFVDSVRELIKNPPPGYSSFTGRRTVPLIKFVSEQRDWEFPDRIAVQSELEAELIGIIERETSPDDLEDLYEQIEDHRGILSEAVVDAANMAIEHQLNEMDSIVSDVDSESTLADHIEAIKKLAKRVNAATERVDQAIKAIQSRIEEVEERTTEAEEPAFSGKMARMPDKYDDDEIESLFSLLL
jgi:energy-coupling factor transporter ATP-binding protein EcfA2